MLACAGTPSTGPGQCQDTVEAVLLGGQCPNAGLKVPSSTFPMGTPIPVDEHTTHSLLHPHLLFLVKFRIVSLDKDFTPSSKKVRIIEPQNILG